VAPGTDGVAGLAAPLGAGLGVWVGVVEHDATSTLRNNATAAFRQDEMGLFFKQIMSKLS
jgi:hypothetical protein